jgi:hypothetical protein
MELLLAPPRLLTPALVSALARRAGAVVPAGADARGPMRAAAAALGLADAPAILEGGAAILLPRAARPAFACLPGPAWIAEGDVALIPIGAPLSAWTPALQNARAWLGAAAAVETDAREYSALVRPARADPDLWRKLEAHAARLDLRLSRVEEQWLLHARFGAAAAFRHVRQAYAARAPDLRTIACGLGELAPADACFGTVEAFLDA